jgi:HK97 family phage major capsid protein
MSKLSELKSEREEAVSEMEQIPVQAEVEARDVSDEEQARFDALDAECEKLALAIRTEESLLRRRAEVEAAKVPESAGRATPPVKPVSPLPASAGTNPGQIVVPATVKRWGNLTAFRGPAADIKAYKAGMFYLAAAGHDGAAAWLRDKGILAAAQVENVNTRGGYLVYDELDNAIIDLRDPYGVFARNARRVAMSSDVMIRPRRSGGLTAYFVGEDSAITEYNKAWDKVELVAKKLAVIARISNELREDAIINIADDLTNELAWAFAKKIDECGFIGDGTSTYGGMFGVSPRLAAVNGVDDGGGLVLSANNTMIDFTITELAKLVSICPAYALSRAKWYCSTLVYGQVMLRLCTAGGGNTIRDLEGGLTTRQFLGFPVEVTEVLPTSDANSQIYILFGDLALAADVGDRRQTSIAISDSAYVGSTSVFDRDEIALRGTIRFDINAHDVGTASAAGPVVGLIGAAA